MSKILMTLQKNLGKGNQPFYEPETNSWVDQLQKVFVELPIPVRQIPSRSVQFSLDLLDCNLRGPIMYVYWLF